MRLLSIGAAVIGLLLSGPLVAQSTEPSTESRLPPQPTMPPPPVPAVDPANVWHLDLSNGGRVSIQLRPDAAPGHVERIKTLTGQGFYNGLAFHRVIEGFMAQGGDPDGTGAGSSTLPDLPSEINGLPHVRGAVSMARAQAFNSANSQFFIMFAPRLVLDRNYTVFGRVIAGMNQVDAIERGEPPPNPTRIVRASLGSDNLPPLTAEQLRAAAAATASAAARPAPTTRQGPAVPPPPSIRMPDPPTPQPRRRPPPRQ